MTDLTRHLEIILNAGLPGLSSQARMAPAGRVKALEKMKVPDTARESAVLIALYPGESGWEFPLIRRKTYEGVHSGQIGLPGGKVEDFDKDHWDTALREANEEIGLKPSATRRIGELSPLYIPPSNFIVFPKVVVVESEISWQNDPIEVEELIKAPLDQLRDNKRINEDAFVSSSSGVRVKAPYFNIMEQKVWGATAMILAEFRDCLLQIDQG